MVILEPGISSNRARSVISKLGFSNVDIFYAIGYSGGIWVLWHNHKCKLRVISCLDQSVTMCVDLVGGNSWLSLPFYGHPCPSCRIQHVSLKAPGPCGYSLSIKRSFSILLGKKIKEDLTSMVMRCFPTSDIPQGLNSTLFSLVPKVPCPQSMDQL